MRVHDKHDPRFEPVVARNRPSFAVFKVVISGEVTFHLNVSEPPFGRLVPGLPATNSLA